LSSAQVTEVPSAKTVPLPVFRPILIGQGPDALINRIDTEDLIKKGQKDGWVRFICAVRKNGDVTWSQLFGSAPNSELLKIEVAKRLSAAANPKFLPAVFNHETVDAIYYGTLTLKVMNGKPRLRIFSNQEQAEVEAESNFISTQPYFGPGSKFTGFHYPENTAHMPLDGVVQVHIKVDAKGNFGGGEVVSEEPPFQGFGQAAAKDLHDAGYIPGFRDGAPVDCEVTIPVLYKAKAF
jgi:TonB family protein